MEVAGTALLRSRRVFLSLLRGLQALADLFCQVTRALKQSGGGVFTERVAKAAVSPRRCRCRGRLRWGKVSGSEGRDAALQLRLSVSDRIRGGSRRERLRFRSVEA